MTIVYLAIGTNIGDREENYNKAMQSLAGIKGIRILKESSRYLTRPVGGPKQRDYLNGIVKIETELTAHQVLREIKNIEKEMGRKKETELNRPRIIDLDIVLFGDEIITGPDLLVPHPRMHERGFVLKGLSEIAPGFLHPVLKKTIKELYENNIKNSRND